MVHAYNGIIDSHVDPYVLIKKHIEKAISWKKATFKNSIDNFLVKVLLLKDWKHIVIHKNMWILLNPRLESSAFHLRHFWNVRIAQSIVIMWSCKCVAAGSSKHMLTTSRCLLDVCIFLVLFWIASLFCLKERNAKNFWIGFLSSLPIGPSTYNLTSSGLKYFIFKVRGLKHVLSYFISFHKVLHPFPTNPKCLKTWHRMWILV